MYVLVVAISGGDVVATSVVAKSAPSNEQALTGVDSFAGIPSEDAVICSLTLVGMRVRQIQSRNLTNVSI